MKERLFSPSRGTLRAATAGAILFGSMFTGSVSSSSEIDDNVRDRNTLSGEIEICAQTLTSAVNPETGECQVFPTSCLPEGWIRVKICKAGEFLIHFPALEKQGKTP